MALLWTRRHLRLMLMLALAAAAVLLLEATPVWSRLGLALRSVDFDAGRTALIEAWIAGFAVALLAALLSGRAWISTFTAVAFVGATYALPWAWNAARPGAVPFGPPPQLDLAGLARNLGVVTGASLLVAIPAAATGWLVRSSLGRVSPARPPHGLLAVATLAAVAAGALATAAGIDPVLRYGPEHGIYRAAASVPSGQVLYRSFAARAGGPHRSFAVYLPPGYAGQPERHYPVVYLLHGDPGSYRDWVNLGAPQILNDGIHSGSVPPAILVMPDGNGAAGASSQWADSADGRSRVESSVMELVQLVDRDYRTLPGARGRIVAGLSEGGFGAANLAARHPEVFGSALSLSGYFSAQGQVFGGQQSYLDANSPAYLVRHHPPARRVEYVLVVGRDDARYLSAADRFAAELSQEHVAHQVIVLPGGHESAVWTRGLAAGLQRLLPRAGLAAPALGSSPLSMLPGLLPLAGLILGERSPAEPEDRSKRPSRASRLLGAVNRGAGRLRLGTPPAAVRALLTLVALADVVLAADAWLIRHHAWHSALALALAPLAPLRLLMGGALAAIALYVASRARSGFRYLLVGLAAVGGILAITADQPLLIAIAVADCLLALLAGSLWTESSHHRASLAGGALLVTATAVTAGLFMYQHPQHKLASLLTLLLVMAFAAAVSGLTLLDRNAAMPSHRDPRRARELLDRTGWAGVSPFALVGRKRHYWAADGSAFVAYGCRAGVALALGPALGSPDIASRLLDDFRRAARRRGWRPALYQVPGSLARQLGWGHRYLLGSEAIVDLEGLSLDGPARARLRHDVARGNRAGLHLELVEETDLDPATTAAMAALARSSARHRRLGQMSFSVGRRSDDCQVRRSVGLARDPEGRLAAYTTWLWLPAAGTVVLDEVQRSPNAPPGTMDALMWRCLVGFRPDVQQASLGMAPIADAAQAERLARLEALVRKALGLSSLAPGLYSFKAKFGPAWEPRYLVVESWLDWPAVWVAVFLLHFPHVLRNWMQPAPRPAPRSA